VRVGEAAVEQDERVGPPGLPRRERERDHPPTSAPRGSRRAHRFDLDEECLACLPELEAVGERLHHPDVPDGFDFTADLCPRCGAWDWAVHHWDVLERPLRLRKSVSNLVPPAG
jgi:hypothetical protein